MEERAGPPQSPKRNDVGLPPRPFLYTLDQVAMLLSTTLEALKTQHVYYEGKSVGPCPPRKLRVVNINPDLSKRPDWRCSEQELIRWMRSRGFRHHETGWVQ